jgi:hypothetical protein
MQGKWFIASAIITAGCAGGPEPTDVDEANDELGSRGVCAEMHAPSGPCATSNRSSGPVGRALIETPAGPETIDFEDVDGLAIAEGDMILGETAELTAIVHQANGTARKGAQWPKGIVYYTIDKKLPNSARVTNAIAHVRANTDIEFRKWDADAGVKDYVKFTTGSGCSSYVGRVGGMQTINLASSCSTGSVIHEIGHALGLFHEQSHPDRDQFVTIHWDNIIPARKSQFRIEANARELTTYDFGSIMHYSATAFSKNGKATISRKDGKKLVAQRNGLSSKDKAGIAALYANEIGKGKAAE